MKKTTLSFLLLLVFFQLFSQSVSTPDKLWGQLFKDVQLARALGDNKTFVDMVPKYAPAVVLQKYGQLKNKDSASLRSFVLANFYLPPTPEINVTQGLSLQQHLHELWHTLTRKADKKIPYSTLLPLPESYIVPGGRFREIYYWDSYFTMLGLAVSNRYDLMENMLDNFKSLIDNYGHIPNGNRSYYLSRSQPPYYALMVELLAKEKGDAVYKKYYTAMEKEYSWWMSGSEKLKRGQAFRRVVKMPEGEILNRYFDDKNAPREESYAEDFLTAKQYALTDSLAYTNLRASAESGWDFSSRWFADTLHLTTIETTNIVPVDLNSLLFAYENVLSKAAEVMGNRSKADYYDEQAEKRQQAVLRYCWNADLNFFFDFDFFENTPTNKWSIAGAMPLFTRLATPHHALFVAQNIREKFLKAGGVVTTLYHTGQQWDAPNGWPPLQYIAVKGLLDYGYHDLPQTIAERWMDLNEKVFAATGKMMEKYNVENVHLESGGGEYPTQDGFGWTNGVYLKFYDMFRKKEKGY